MARRILNRKDLRADYEAAERRKDEEEREDDEEEDTDDEEDEEEDETDSDEEAEDDDDDFDDLDEEADDDEDEDRPRKRKKSKEKSATEAKKGRSRSGKMVRQRVVWGVFTNSNQCVATYEYPRKAEAEQHAARLTQDKKSTHFVQPVKEPWEEREKKGK
ncbi:MAG: hypothetical protein NZO58_02145 [Gemmataceae bacterium]|nr:hypothetical protein [Gemmataceae bacterium]